MNDYQVLDCTLRDGGYLVDKEFGDSNIRGIITGLVQAKIDIVELGFLQNEGFGAGKVVFLNEKEAQKYIPKDRGESKFAAFADCSRYDISHLGPRTEESFEIVRECFFKHEIDKALDNCKRIQELGYICFVQPVDILGYSDKELIELIEKVNAVGAYCLSIVDTFGSMYQDDLRRVFYLIDNNLNQNCRIGFHSHNNLQLSSALSQCFAELAQGKRKVVIDGTISGMGRGAGNTPTELLVQYFVAKKNADYELDYLLDVIDDHMRNLQSRAKWGYDTSFFIAGAYNTHVNNIAYLQKKSSLKARDMRYIINRLDPIQRKRYDYDLLDQQYVNYIDSDIDDSADFCSLEEELKAKNVIVIAAGKTIFNQKELIDRWIKKNQAVVISINCVYNEFKSDYVFISNAKRYSAWINRKDVRLILTSNLKADDSCNAYVIQLRRLIKCGWQNMDNATIVLLRLLNLLGVSKIGVAGFDGYAYKDNYAKKDMEYELSSHDVMKINKELQEMYHDVLKCKNEATSIELVTKSDYIE